MSTNYAVPVAKLCTCCELNEFVMQASSWEELQLAVESRVMSAEQAIGLEKGSSCSLKACIIIPLFNDLCSMFPGTHTPASFQESLCVSGIKSA